MKYRHFKLLPVFLLAAGLIASCGGGDQQSSSDSSGFNPPVSNPPEVTGTPTGLALPTEDIAMPPAATNTIEPTESLSNPELVGEVLVNNRCTLCHTASRIENASKTPAEWQATVERMIGQGAVLDPQEKEAVVTYLSAAFPK